MKNVLLGLLLIITGTKANATSLKPAAEARLKTFNFAEGSSLANSGITSGQIEINYVAGTVTLKLQPAFHCPAGMMCAMVMPAPIEISVPLTSRFVDRCGSEHYQGEEDLMPADGLKQVIRVTDHTRNTCPTFVVLPATSVSLQQEGYARMEAVHFLHTHTFTAEQLK
jgi:hypothetical protein